jgi:HEAT repeat protein
VGGQSINNAAATPLTSDPAPSGGAVPYQDKSGNDEHTPFDGSQSIAEKDSTFISQRVAESYERSLAKQSVEVESEEQESDQKARSDEVVQALTTALKDKDPHVRLNAIWALASAHGKIAQEALIAALSDEDARVRAQAAWGLGIHGDQKAVEPLIAALRDSSPRVVAQSAWALGMRGDNRAINALKGLLNNPDDHIRRQAAWALGMLLMRSSDAENEDEEEPESDGDVIHRVHIRPHPIPNPRVYVNVSPRFRPAN